MSKSRLLQRHPKASVCGKGLVKRESYGCPSLTSVIRLPTMGLKYMWTGSQLFCKNVVWSTVVRKPGSRGELANVI